MNKRLNSQTDSPGKGDVVCIDDSTNKPPGKSKTDARRPIISRTTHTPKIAISRPVVNTSKYSNLDRKMGPVSKAVAGASNVRIQDATPTAVYNRITSIGIPTQVASPNNVVKRKPPTRITLVPSVEESNERIIPILSEVTGKPIVNSVISGKIEAANGHLFVTQLLPSQLSVTPVRQALPKLIHLTPKVQSPKISTLTQRKYLCSRCKKPSSTPELCDSCQSASSVSSSSQVVQGPGTPRVEKPSSSTMPKGSFMTKEKFYGKPTSTSTPLQGNSHHRKVLVSNETKPRGRPRGSRNRAIEPECLTIESSDEEGDEETQACEVSSITPTRTRQRRATSGYLRRVLTVSAKESNNRRPSYCHVKNPADSSVMIENEDHEIIDEDEEEMEEEEEEEVEDEDEGIEAEHPGNNSIPFNEGRSPKPQSLKLLCRSIRIGSFKIHPLDDLPHLSVSVNTDHFFFRVSKTTKASDLAPISLKAEDIVQVLGHFGRCLPIIFIFTTPSCAAKIRLRLGMVKGSHLYYDPEVDDEKQKRITFLIDNMNEDMKNYLRSVFPGDGILKEIDQKQANEILVKSTPNQIGQRNSTPTYQSPPPPPPQPPPIVTMSATILQIQPAAQLTVQPLQSVVQSLQPQGTVTVTVPIQLQALSQKEIPSPPKEMPVKNERPASPVRKIVTYPPPPETDNIELNNVDLACLEEAEFLNDKIIDFYLRYLVLEMLPEEDRKRTHVFNSYFYRGLTQKPTKRSTEDRQKSMAELRHRQVKKWTKNLDIFEKDFIIIPINQQVHWFLAIICYPRLASEGKKLPKNISVTNNKTSEVHSGNMIVINTISPIKTTEQACSTNDGCSVENDSPEYYESNGDDGESPVKKSPSEMPNTTNPNHPVPGQKMPFIILFDSLPGPSRQLIGKTLKEYLEWEWKSKKGNSGPMFDTASVLYSTACLPQQNNYSDCGIYVLQYVESFFEDPFPYIAYPLPDMRNWFSAEKVATKREEIKALIYSLEKRQLSSVSSSSDNTNDERMEDNSSSTNSTQNS